MDQSVLNSFRDGPEHKYLYCDSCNSLLPAPGFYCVKCDPPQGPRAFSENELPFPQAMLRISILVVFFLVIAVLKLDVNVLEVFSPGQGEMKMKVAEDEDFKIVFKVNTGMVNVRSLPNMKTSKIVGSISLGTQVEVVGTERGWSKIKHKPESGSEFKTGWVATKFLDSEIK